MNGKFINFIETQIQSSMRIKIYIAALLLLCGNIFADAKRVTLLSPDKKTEIIVEIGRSLAYTLLHNGDTLMANSIMGMTLTDGTRWGETPKLSKKKSRTVKEEIVSPFYKCDRFTTAYNEVDLAFKGGYGVIFRAYNEGVAYRFYDRYDRELRIAGETVQMNFTADHPLYLSYSTNREKPFAISFQTNFTVTSLSQADDTQVAYLPATVDYGNGLKMTLLESDVESYPGMFVKAFPAENRLEAVFAPYPAEMAYYKWRRMSYVEKDEPYICRSNGKRSYPWRAFAITEKDTDMPVNHLVYALAAPNRVGSIDWIKPGKAAWDWWNDWGLTGVDFVAGINTKTYKYYIDFAAKNRIEYIILDEGWYDPARGDMLTVIPEIDLEELVTYGKQRNVDIVLWCVFNVLDDQLQEACKKYAEMGIKGFKVDFLDRNDQTAVEMAYRIADAAADHRLFLDYHGFYTPTGFTRTYPNILNVEAVNGIEEFKWCSPQQDIPQYDVTFPFIRLMAGPVDYTPGAMRNAAKGQFAANYKNPVSMGTRCHQLACYVIHDSPFTMLCDAPTAYMAEQECTDFIVQMPVAPDETKVLSGELGKYIVTARRKGNDWYIGGYTNWEARDAEISLDFLPAGKSYSAILMQDGANAHEQACDYRKSRFKADRNYKKTLHMAPAGGFALILKAM